MSKTLTCVLMIVAAVAGGALTGLCVGFTQIVGQPMTGMFNGLTIAIPVATIVAMAALAASLDS